MTSSRTKDFLNLVPWWLLAIGALVTFFGLNAWTTEPATEETH